MESTRQHSLENILGLKQFGAIADFGHSLHFRAASGIGGRAALWP
jgi:hypothetical protein